MDKNIEIKAIQGYEIIPYLNWCDDVTERKKTDSEPITSIIANAMNGVYHGLLGLVDGKPVGLLLYHMINEHKIAFKFMYIRSNMVRVYMALMEYLNKYSIDWFDFESFHEPKIYERLFPGRIKKISTTYSFDVAGLFKETLLSLSQKKRLDIQNEM